VVYFRDLSNSFDSWRIRELEIVIIIDFLGGDPCRWATMPDDNLFSRGFFVGCNYFASACGDWNGYISRVKPCHKTLRLTG